MKEIPWTHFHDMHSGGGLKEKFSHIFIQAPEKEAKVIFYKRFGHNPERISCTCCGEDYAISEHQSLEQATGFERGCKFDNDANAYVEEPSTDEWMSNVYITLDEYKARPDVLVISANEIKGDERKGDVPAQGYVWVD